MKSLFYILTILLTSAICSCKNTQYVPINSVTQIRDSIVLRDSIIKKEYVNSKDSIVLRDSFVIVMDDKGNVIRTELYKQKEAYKDLQKEYSDLQAKYNSLLSQKTDSIQVPYPVEAQLTKWQQFKQSVGGFAIAAIIIIILIVVGWLIYKLKK